MKHAPRKRPAYGKICSQCNKRNHFAKYCWTKDIQDVTESDHKSHFGEIDKIIIDRVEKYTETTKIQINGNLIDIKIDSGAKANMLSGQDFQKLCLDLN